MLITGGSRGIGRALVEELAKEWDVVFTWRHGEQQSHDVIDSCEELSGRVTSYRCDGSNEADVDVLAPQLLEKYGPPGAVIHNAGITGDGLHIQQNGDNWRNVIDTNLNAIFYWNKHLLPPMMMQGEGAVLLMSSVTAIKGNIGQSAYGASKAAMIGLGRSLALEMGRFGIRVNCLLPGIIDSDMTRNMPTEALKGLRKQIPLRRLGDAQEVARVSAFMIGNDSRYMTGQALVLDGGLTA
ncbi:SDR family oxidoreductase [Yersinia sp. 2105 StPb PI]|nr:NAD(P)-dependent oxidoreductase [Yersinia frederiksenii]RXA96821.1 SDR family oxidoreductase [Yersinia sp. 2105 StPb PI]